ncbi:MAG TPA: hypothetical protein VJL87_06945 [Bdellovibrionota bacterium]|nr:hypothetical protein [Bdellovibrionota bacterium]
MAKTTIEIADSLIIRAKKMAAELGSPLRAIVEAALRSYLSKILAQKRPPKKELKIRWKTVAGEISPGLDLKSREKMHNWLK